MSVCLCVGGLWNGTPEVGCCQKGSGCHTGMGSSCGTGGQSAPGGGPMDAVPEKRPCGAHRLACGTQRPFKMVSVAFSWSNSCICVCFPFHLHLR